MEVSLQTTTSLIGGKWLLKESTPGEIFIPENLSEEQILIRESCHQFISTEIYPHLKELETMKPGLMHELLAKAGQLGFIGAVIPEKYGGLEKDIITSTIIMERLGSAYSFSICLFAHMSIGMMPLLYFGTEEQKQKYLPKLTECECIAAYALTEPNSGSDAMSIRTTARLSDDGKHYLLNGQKCWITNGGIANVFTVFAKIEGQEIPGSPSGFTAFIIEKGFEGFAVGAEERKIGLKGSSTAQLFFHDCKVPVENVLGQRGFGHIIAFNILNMGRYKLCAGTVGCSKSLATLSVKYAISREQFKTPIANFGAIKHKLAQMSILCWVAESAMYRTCEWIKDKKEELLNAGKSEEASFLAASQEFAIECAILKIFGSEMLDFTVDEGLQIHGGNGFSEDYEIGRAFRDSRISRIYEGTNEINRILIVEMLLKRSLKGTFNLKKHAVSSLEELADIPDHSVNGKYVFSEEKTYIANFKKATAIIMNAAFEHFTNLSNEQEVMLYIADMVINVFVAESALLRSMKLVEECGEPANGLQSDMVRTFICDAADLIYTAGRNVINRLSKDEDELLTFRIAIKKFTEIEPFDTVAARRRIAEKMIEEKKYCF